MFFVITVLSVLLASIFRFIIYCSQNILLNHVSVEAKRHLSFQYSTIFLKAFLFFIFCLFHSWYSFSIPFTVHGTYITLRSFNLNVVIDEHIFYGNELSHYLSFFPTLYISISIIYLYICIFVGLILTLTIVRLFCFSGKLFPILCH